ncbi:hypothetical protein MtrunA17_Chr3g0106351 [Medicago truncatula]|uniref:Uncharacterized protein n=1 Tax=Medicago truncatula TaxID=3880 RepID=A0A396ITG3_MEDTR|nr:hypothetical protein MtrunA17_Chr3g0106351 [Medicago truncatula]
MEYAVTKFPKETLKNQYLLSESQALTVDSYIPHTGKYLYSLSIV